MNQNPRFLNENFLKIHKMAGSVKRFHTENTVRTQTIADHVYNILRIYTSIWGIPDQDDLKLIVYHDVEEVLLGDIPHWTGRIMHLKNAYRKAEDDVRKLYPQLPAGKSFRVKVCDYIDALEFMLSEVLLGNRTMQEGLERLYDEFRRFITEPEPYVSGRLIESYLEATEFEINYSYVVDGIDRG